MLFNTRNIIVLCTTADIFISTYNLVHTWKLTSSCSHTNKSFRLHLKCLKVTFLLWYTRLNRINESRLNAALRLSAMFHIRFSPDIIQLNPHIQPFKILIW